MDHQIAELDLLMQLECILQHDTCIDEIGFVHPTQLKELKKDAMDNHLDEEISEVSLIQYDKSVFWHNDHKLAISTDVLSQLHGAALQAFLDADRRYKQLINHQIKTDETTDSLLSLCDSNSEGMLGNAVLIHTKVLLIMGPDFSTAWNSRKLLISRDGNCASFMGELQLSELILSFSPKSESAWAHRRWVIKTISGNHPNMEEIIGKESALVQKIGEKTRMNYRAWNHRCWLVSYMSRTQMVEELNKSRRWAKLHIADNSCFHYHRRLLHKMMEGIFPRQEPQSCSNQALDLYLIWKEELDWDRSLVEKYIGREALWVHRRFLVQFWFIHFMGYQSDQLYLENQNHTTFDSDEILHQEMLLVRSCLDASNDEFEEGNIQAEHAACYLLWIWKQALQFPHIRIQEKMREMEDLQIIMLKFCPEKSFLWDALAVLHVDHH